MPTYERQNFAQAEPNTPIHVGQTGNVYRRCNLTNCRVTDDAAIETCQISQAIRWTETVEIDLDGVTVTVEQPMSAWVGRGVKGEVSGASVEAGAAELGVA